MKFKITYEAILRAHYQFVVGNDRPSFIQVGLETYHQILEYFDQEVKGLRRRGIKALYIEDAVVVPVPHMEEGILRFVNAERPNAISLNGEVTIERAAA